MAKRKVWALALTILSPIVLAIMGLWALMTKDFQVFGLETRPAILVFGWTFIIIGTLGMVGWVKTLLEKVGIK